MGAELDGRDRRSEHLCRLGDAQAFLFDEPERRALGLRKAGKDPVDPHRKLVGVHHVVRRRVIGRARVGIDLVRVRLPLAPAQPIQKQSPRDRKRPGRHLGAWDEANASPMDVQHRLLEKVLGTSSVFRLAQEVAVKAWREHVVHCRERGVIAAGVPLHRNIDLRAQLHVAACTTRPGRKRMRKTQRTLVHRREYAALGPEFRVGTLDCLARGHSRPTC